MVWQNFLNMFPDGWLKKKMFYFLAGIVCMVPVIWIARTSLFHFCYIPLILASFLLSGQISHESEIQIPSRMIQIVGFIGGMLVSEFLFALILILKGGLILSKESIQEWQILLIELLLGIAVFLFFFAISIAKNRLFRRF